MHRYPDVLYGQYCAPGGEQACGDIFFFDYGCITFWGLSQKQARAPAGLPPARWAAAGAAPCYGAPRAMAGPAAPA